MKYLPCTFIIVARIISNKQLAVADLITWLFRSRLPKFHNDSLDVYKRQVFILALTTALGFSVLHFQPFSEGTTWLDFWDFIVSTNILPLGSRCV